MSNSNKQKHQAASTPLSLMLAVAATSALAGFGAVYVTLARPDNGTSGTAGKAVSVAAAPATVPTGPKPPSGTRLNVGHMTAFVYKTALEPLPEVAFTNGEGKPMTLAHFKGKTVLLNLWATWCAPCRKEMPALDSLQKELGNDKFEVVALAVDRGGIEGAKKFLTETRVSNLKLYVDATARGTSTLKAVGLPTTILIDPEGREIGRLMGPAEWDSTDAKKLILAAAGG